MPEDRLAQLLVTQAWQIALLTVVVAITVKLLATKRPRLAHLLWLIVVVKCVTPPVWSHSCGLFSQLSSSITSRRAVPTSVVAKPSIKKVNVGPGSFTFPTEAPAYRPDSASEIITASSEVVVSRWKPTSASNSAQNQLWSWLWWSLVTGMLVSAVVLTTKFVRCLRRIRSHRVTEFDDVLEQLVKDLSQQLKLRRIPRVIVSDVRFGPAVLGVFRHLIVLPRCLVEGMVDSVSSGNGEHSLRPILAHELLHIRRGDLWVGALQAAVRCLWWFHPAVWIVNRMLSRETERCCDEQVVEELGCSPMQYAKSLLAVIESKHRLQPVPVFPGMKPVEITSKRMERIMSLTQGSRTRMSWWSVVAVLLFAVVVLPGAVKGHPADDTSVDTDAKQPMATTDEGQTDSSRGDSAAKPKAVTVEYEAGDLIQQLEKQQSLSPENARDFLLMDLIQIAGSSRVRSLPTEIVPIDGEKHGKLSSGLAIQYSSLAVWEKDTLVVTHEAVGHERIRERLAQFRKYGFGMVRISTTIVSGPRELVETLVTDWSIVPTDLADSATRSDYGIIPLADKPAAPDETSGRVIQQVGHITESVQHSRPVLLKFADENAIAELLQHAQLHPKINVQHMPKTSGWNGAERNVRDCVIRPFVVGYDDGKPQIRPLTEGLSMNLRPEVKPDGILLGCAVELNEITNVRIAVLKQVVNGKPLNVQIPEYHTRRLTAQVRTQPTQTLIIGGLNMKNGDQPEESLLVLVKAEPVEPFTEGTGGRSQRQDDANGEVGLSSGDEADVLGNPLPKGWEAIGRSENASIENRDDVAQRVAAEKARARRAIARSNNGPSSATREKLQSDVSFKFERTPLTEVLREIAMAHGLNVALDVYSFDDPETIKNVPVSIEVNAVSLQTAIGLICDQHGLAFKTQWRVITIFKPKPASSRFTARIYPVGDLVVPIPSSVPNKDNAELQQADFSGLVELIKTTIQPGNWGDGRGSVAPNENTLSLIVRQTDEVHEQVMELLIQLRELQDVQISTEYRVIQFNTPEQLQWLEDHVTFQQRPGSHSWALLPLDTDSGEGFPLDGHGKTLSAPKITTFVGQEASLEVGGGSDFKLTLMSAARPRRGDRLLELSYAVPRENGRRSMQPQPLINQIIGNGQTLLLDVTETAKPVGPTFLDSSLSQAERIKAELEQNERIKLAKKRRGRIIVAITPRIIRQEEEEELILGTP